MRRVKLIVKAIACAFVVWFGLFMFNQLTEITPDMGVGIGICGLAMFGCALECIRCIVELFKSKTTA